MLIAFPHNNGCTNAPRCHVIYRVSIKIFPCLQTNVYLDMLQLHVAPQLEDFQKMVQLHTGVHMFVSFWMQQQVDWERWSDTLATTIAGYHPP